MTSGQSSAVEKVLYGNSVSPGIGMSRCVVVNHARPSIIERNISPKETSQELDRFQKALLLTMHQLEDVEAKVREMIGQKDAEIFASHQLVLEDQILLDEIARLIQVELLPAELAADKVFKKCISSFEKLSDEYFKQRVADIKDVSSRLIDNLTGWVSTWYETLSETTILVGKDFSPSETVQWDHKLIVGVITEQGGPTSHVAILARSLRIPAISGLDNATEQLKTGQFLLLDGYKGAVIVSPTVKTRLAYGKYLEKIQTIEQELEADSRKPSVTLDGRYVLLGANLAKAMDAQKAYSFGVEGIGLFRTEFFFLNKEQLPTEEEQYEVYRKVGISMNKRPVVIRTLDIGGDKNSPGLSLSEEDNPFLGCRAIRLCLKYSHIFKVQLRALLRAGAVCKNLKIMYPMISSLEEFDRAQELLKECMMELDREGVEYNPEIEVGIMIEIPSAVVCAQELAHRAAFFSIGTNDLIQYTLAVDRINPAVNHLYQPTHPAVIRLISDTVRAAHGGRRSGGIPVAICGEMAGMPELIPLLIGLGVDELSVSLPLLSKIHCLIRRVSFQECQKLAHQAMEMKYAAQIQELSAQFAKEAAPEVFLN